MMVAYVDTTPGNQGTGNTARRDDDVDLTAGSIFVNNTVDGEWLEFTRDVVPGVYDINVSAWSNNTTAKGVRLLIAENAFSNSFTELGSVEIPDTDNERLDFLIETVDLTAWGGEDRVFRVEFYAGEVDIVVAPVGVELTPEGTPVSYLEYPITNTTDPTNGSNWYNGSGLTDSSIVETGDVVPATWPLHEVGNSSERVSRIRNADADNTLTFDLGGAFDLSEMALWNSTEAGQTGRGFENTVLSYSTDNGATYSGSDTLTWTDLASVTAPFGPEFRPLPGIVSGVTHVRMEVDNFSSSSIVMASEIRFIGKGAPVAGGNLNLNFNSLEFVTKPQSRYAAVTETVVQDGTQILAEEFDEGGQLVAYYDSTPGYDGNGGTGNGVRPGDDVDLFAGSIVLSHITDGEWLEFTRDVVPGVYDIDVKAWSANSNIKGVRILISDDASNYEFAELGSIDVPDTGADRPTFTIPNVDLTAWGGADRVFRVELFGSNFSYDWIEFQSVTSPEITVSNASSDVADDSGVVDFGSVDQGTTQIQTLTVANTGTAALTLDEPITVPAGFTIVSSFDSTTLLPGETTTFAVQIDTTNLASLSGDISFTNNDADESPFNFTVQGTVVEAEADTAVIDGLWLVNADSDADIVSLTEGLVINLADLATTNLNVRATTDVTVGSVGFELTGATTRSQGETNAPYALFGDTAGDFNAGAFAVGQHTLVVTPYSGAGLSGTAGTPHTISFEVVGRSLADLSVSTANRQYDLTQGTEAGTAIEFTVTLSEQNLTGAPITFDLEDLGTGTATSGVDYEAIAAGAQICVPPGATTGTFSVNVIDDFRIEATELVNARISNPSHPSVTIGNPTTVATIADNDTAGVTVTGADDLAISEAGTTDTYTIALDSVPDGTVQITATADAQTQISIDGVNFASSQVLSFTDMTPQTVTVRAIDDGVAEDEHSAKITHAITGTIEDPNYPDVTVESLYTQTGTDLPFQDLIDSGALPDGVTSTDGILGSTIDVNNSVVEQGVNGNTPIREDIQIHTLGNSGVPRSQFDRWTRWYQEDGNTQVYRLFEGEENVRNSRDLAARIESWSPGWQKGTWHDFSATYTIVKPHEMIVFQAFQSAVEWSVHLNMTDDGDLYFTHRRVDGSQLDVPLAENMIGKSFDLLVRENGDDYEFYFNGELKGVGQYDRPDDEISFRWGMYRGSHPMTHEALVFVTGANIETNTDTPVGLVPYRPATTSLSIAPVTVAIADNDLASLSLDIVGVSISENGGTTTAVVSRNTDTTNALTVTLASNDTSEAMVPATITIPAGQATSAPFTITGVDDLIVDGTQTVTVTATSTGHADSTDTVDVTDDDLAALTLDIVGASISENGGTTTSVVSRNTDTTNALTVTLTSNDTSEATVPATITIPAGQTTSAPFTITGVDDLVFDGTQTVTVSARADNHFDGADTVDVTDNENNLDVTAPSATVRALPLVTNTSTFELTVELDDPSSDDGRLVSGVATYDLFVAIDDGGYTLYADDMPASQTTIVFTPQSNHRYWF